MKTNEIVAQDGGMASKPLLTAVTQGAAVLYEKKIDKTKEGWSDDISGTSGRLRHYYKDGVSLCGKWSQKHYFKNFDNESNGNRYFCDCSICINRLKKIKIKK